MALWFFFAQRGRPYRIKPIQLIPERKTAAEIASIGAPFFLAGLGATLLAVLINTTLAMVGVAMIAAYTVSARVQTFVSMPQTGITQGTQPIIGYNAGRELWQRVAGTRSLALRSTAIYGAIAGVLIAAAAPLVVTFFMGGSATGQQAVVALRYIAAGFAFAGVAPVISACFQALGRPKPSYAISIGTLLPIKLPLLLLLGRLGPNGVWVAIPLGEALAALAALILLRAANPGPKRDQPARERSPRNPDQG